MPAVKLNLKKRSYQIVIGRGILKVMGREIKKLRIGSDAYIITNPSVRKRYGRVLAGALKHAGLSVKFKIVPDREQSKSIEIASVVIKDLASYDRKKRRIFIIAFGGGVIGDLAGFVASVYKRGVAYIQVPTTLLAQVDSSIGGKTAVDLSQGKNLVGAFHQPRMVYSDVDLLRTLDIRQLRSGLAEVIKYAIIKDKRLFQYLEKRYTDILALKLSALEFLVRRSSQIKALIVQQDEREEKGIRTVLNFGHTLGHALEAAGNYRGYNHGEAIGLGMLCATDLSSKLGLLKDRISERIERLLKSVGLPTKIEKKNLPLDKIIRAYDHDKKFMGARNRFVLLEDIGRTKIKENIPLGIIGGVLKARMS